MSSQLQVAVAQTGVPICPVASGPVPSLGHSSRPWRLNSLGSSPSRCHRQTLQRFLLGDHWWHLVGWSNLTTTTLAGITIGQALRFLRPIGIWEEPGVTPYVVVSTMEAGSLGAHAGLASMWTCIQCPQMSVLLCILMVPNGGRVTLYVVQTCPWTLSRLNSLGNSWVGGCGGSGPLQHLCPPCAFMEQLE